MSSSLWMMLELGVVIVIGGSLPLSSSLLPCWSSSSSDDAGDGGGRCQW